MRKSTIRILLAGLTISAGTLMVAGPAAAKPGPTFDDHPPFQTPIPCWQLPGGCVADPVDPPADPPADPEPEPQQPDQPVDPGTPAGPGTGGPANPSGQFPTGQATGANGSEPAPPTDALPVVDQEAADEDASEASPMVFVAADVLVAALAALAIVAVLRLRRRAVIH